eukprot:1533152-Rhodomonas_salina.2
MTQREKRRTGWRGREERGQQRLPGLRARPWGGGRGGRGGARRRPGGVRPGESTGLATALISRPQMSDGSEMGAEGAGCHAAEPAARRKVE